MIFGRTDLRISLSEAKFDAEADFDVRSAVAPQKPEQINEKLIFRSICIFTSFHKISTFRYQKLDFGCLKWCRMIPGTK